MSTFELCINNEFSYLECFKAIDQSLHEQKARFSRTVDIKEIETHFCKYRVLKLDLATPENYQRIKEMT